MSDRSIDPETHRKNEDRKGQGDDPPEEYTTYPQVEPGKATDAEAEALREAELQPGGAEPEPDPDEESADRG